MPDKLVDIDLASPVLTEREAQLLHAVTVQYGKYLNRADELRQHRAGLAAHDERMKAHGVGAALLIMWRFITSSSAGDVPLPDTKAGDLDGPGPLPKG